MFPPHLSAARPARPFVARPRRSGFSLVEVVLAVGVISFAFVAILGLLPAGLQQFRQAMDNSVAAQIAQRVIQDAQLSDFDTLCDTANLSQGILYVRAKSYSAGDAMKQNPIYTRYFDEQGNEIVPQSFAPSQTEQAQIVYFVNTRIVPFTDVPGDVLPRTTPNLATINVQVAFNPSGRAIQVGSDMLFSPDDIKTKNLSVRNFTAQVGRNF